MSNSYLTPAMLAREAVRLAYYFKLVNGLHCWSSDRFKHIPEKKYDLALWLEFPNMEIYTPLYDKKSKIVLSEKALELSLDDFNDKFLIPAIRTMMDWEKAFKMETWV